MKGKVKHLKSKTKSSQPRRQTSEVEKKHFKNLLKNPAEITDKSTKIIINGQLDIKLGQFIEKELYAVLTKIKNRKAAGLNKIFPEVWKTRKVDDMYLQL